MYLFSIILVIMQAFLNILGIILIIDILLITYSHLTINLKTLARKCLQHFLNNRVLKTLFRQIKNKFFLVISVFIK